MKHEGLITAAQLLGVPLDPQQADRLAAYEGFVRDRGPALGLVAKGDIPRLRERHILDSLRAAPVLAEASRDAVDLGSGAGLPGIPLAIALPDLRIIVTEPRRQRVAFLELVVQELGLPNVTVHAGRAEHLPGRWDACLARAFRGAEASWRVAAALLRPGGRLVYYAGARFDATHDMPAGVTGTILPSSDLAKSGPLVIMTRQ
ncbi:MAG: 16S rRNA (guanine(527)-N(7))-methyltransferase RsmG [Actinomycetota bacterium]